MSVPERADKWVVMLVMLAIAGFYLFTSTGIELTVTDVIVIPGAFGVIGTIIYLAWRAVCRVVARLLGGKFSRGSVRAFTNGVFAAVILALMLQPVFFPGYKHTVTIQMPGHTR